MKIAKWKSEIGGGEKKIKCNNGLVEKTKPKKQLDNITVPSIFDIIFSLIKAH